MSDAQRASVDRNLDTSGSGRGHIEIRGLCHEYRDESNRQAVRALDGVDLDIKPGHIVTILGPSGCGKSTLLYIIAGLVTPTQGAITVDGERVRGPGASRGMVFQEFALMPWRTVLRNVAHGLEIQHVPKRERLEIAARFVTLVGLSGFENRYPHELSGGMRQRVAVARTLAADPAVMLMDEPFAAVDAQTRISLQEELIRVKQATGKSVIFVTHSVDEAVFLGDEVVVITRRPGRVKEVVPVDIPKRTASWREVSRLDRFQELRDRMLASVREEAAPR